jgi:hypothetical protein
MLKQLTCDAAEKLAGKVLDMLSRKRRKLVFFQEVVHAHSQELRDKTYMVSVVKPV